MYIVDQCYDCHKAGMILVGCLSIQIAPWLLLIGAFPSSLLQLVIGGFRSTLFKLHTVLSGSALLPVGRCAV